MLLSDVSDSFVYGWDFMPEHQVFYLNLVQNACLLKRVKKFRRSFQESTETLFRMLTIQHKK